MKTHEKSLKIGKKAEIFDFVMKEVIIFMVIEKWTQIAENFGNPFKTTGNFCDFFNEKRRLFL